MNRTQFYTLFRALHKKNEAITASEYRRAIRKDLQALQAETLGALVLTPLDNFREVRKDRFKKNGLQFGNFVYNNLTKDKQKRFNPVFSQAWADFILVNFDKQVGSQITLLKRTIVDEVSKAVNKNISEGDTLVNLTNEIEKVVNSNSFYKWQAERIARTETTTAMEMASNVSANESGLVLEKVWLSAGDGNERESHRELNGTTVGQNETFPNGLAFAGDPSGDPEEIINCRCTIQYVPKLDNNGQIILA